MNSLKLQICQAYKEKQESTEESLKKLEEIENEEINKSDFDFYYYENGLLQVKNEDYEELLKNNEKIRKIVQKITGKEKIKLNLLIKSIIDKTVFDIMVLNIKNHSRQKNNELRISNQDKDKNINEIVKEELNTKSIVFGRMYVGYKIIEELSELLPKKEIISLKGRFKSGDSLDFFKILPMSNIKNLNLSNSKFGDIGRGELFQELNNILSNTQIKFLNLSYTEISYEDIEPLFEKIGITEMKGLDLSNNNIGYKGIEKLKQLLIDTQISFLNLSSNYIGANGMEGVVELLINNNIKSLYIGNNEIFNKGVEILAKKLSKTKIQFLYLQDNNIQDEGVEILASLLPETQLKVLNLSRNSIGKKGINALINILSKTKIEKLNLLDNSKYRNLFGNKEIENIKRVCEENNIELEISEIIK